MTGISAQYWQLLKNNISFCSKQKAKLLVTSLDTPRAYYYSRKTKFYRLLLNAKENNSSKKEIPPIMKSMNDEEHFDVTFVKTRRQQDIKLFSIEKGLRVCN